MSDLKPAAEAPAEGEDAPLFQLSVNWKAILKRAWSVRLNALTALLCGAEVAVQFLPDYVDLPPRVFAGLAVASSIAANFARLMPQKNLEK